MLTATLNLPPLKPGQEFFVDTFDPMTFSVGRTRITCVGEETLDIGWKTLSVIPESELRRINKDLISRYFSEIMEEGVTTPYY